ncbi:hypothetical protein [Desulfoplanes formicivorans]|nr:hypothetical protein [Desulfoplanes formicivorans]
MIIGPKNDPNDSSHHLKDRSPGQGTGRSGHARFFCLRCYEPLQTVRT